MQLTNVQTAIWLQLGSGARQAGALTGEMRSAADVGRHRKQRLAKLTAFGSSPARWIVGRTGENFKKQWHFYTKAEYCDERVCLCVCLPVRVRELISETTCPNIHQIVVGVNYGCGSILFWRRCDTSCTSGFMDDIIDTRQSLWRRGYCPHSGIVLLVLCGRIVLTI